MIMQNISTGYQQWLMQVCVKYHLDKAMTKPAVCILEILKLNPLLWCKTSHTASAVYRHTLCQM